MSLVQGDKIFDRAVTEEVIQLMQLMVKQYMRLNIGCQRLRFYIPDYFSEQLLFFYHDNAPHGLKLTELGLKVWGVEVVTGYENKVILFCPHHIPTLHSPVLEISRFGRPDMCIIQRDE